MRVAGALHVASICVSAAVGEAGDGVVYVLKGCLLAAYKVWAGGTLFPAAPLAPLRCSAGGRGVSGAEGRAEERMRLCLRPPFH